MSSHTAGAEEQRSGDHTPDLRPAADNAREHLGRDSEMASADSGKSTQRPSTFTIGERIDQQEAHLTRCRTFAIGEKRKHASREVGQESGELADATGMLTSSRHRRLFMNSAENQAYKKKYAHEFMEHQRYEQDKSKEFTVSATKSSRLALLSRLNPLHNVPVVDAMTYKVSMINSWSIFFVQGAKTGFSYNTLKTFFKLICVSLSVAAFVMVVVPDPGMVQSSKFHKISEFLRMFVGLLLGFFMTTCVSRWYNATEGLMSLFDSIRNLQLQLISLGVPQEPSVKVIRYGVVSGWLVDTCAKLEMLPPEEREEAEVDMWEEFLGWEDENKELVGSIECNPFFLQRLTQSEIDRLRMVDDPASQLWVWIASLLARLAQDGIVPGMATPGFPRLMALVKDGVDGIRIVRQSVLIQVPFIYVHTLAALVHINNIMSAMSFGVILGSTLGSIFKKTAGNKHIAIYSDAENLVVSLVVSVVGPLLYHTLLEVCMTIAMPFNSQEGNIPSSKLLYNLQMDLVDRLGASRDTSWKLPCFQTMAETRAAAKGTGK